MCGQNAWIWVSADRGVASVQAAVGKGAGAVAWAAWGPLVLPVFPGREGPASGGGRHTKQAGIGVGEA